MPYSQKQLLEHKDPYSLFKNSDDFIRNQKTLDDLSEKKQNDLAVKIVSACPKDQLNSLELSVQPINNSKEESFGAIITKAIQLKSNILQLLDYNHNAPHAFFLAPSTPDLLNQFKDLALHTLKNNEAVIAERLAIHTPEDAISQTVRRIKSIFPNSTFAQKINITFTLRNNIKLLLGNNPENFFISKDFSPEQCREFALLIRQFIEEHEEEIGKKLSQISSSEIRNPIMRQLKQLTTSAYEEIDPFKRILNSMTTSNASPATIPETLFGVPRSRLTKHLSILDGQKITENPSSSGTKLDNNKRTSI